MVSTIFIDYLGFVTIGFWTITTFLILLGIIIMYNHEGAFVEIYKSNTINHEVTFKDSHL